MLFRSAKAEVLNKKTNKKEKKTSIIMAVRYLKHKSPLKSILKMKGSDYIITMDNKSIIIWDCDPLKNSLKRKTYLSINCQNQNILAQINENSFCFSNIGIIEINNIKSFFDLKSSYDLHSKNITCLVKLDEENYASGSEDALINLWDSYFQKKNVFDKHKDVIAQRRNRESPISVMPSGRLTVASESQSINALLPILRDRRAHV